MNATHELPEILEKTLEAGRRRIRRILAFRGLCTTFAVFVVATLGVMAIDAMVTIFSSAVRWLLWCGVLAATGATAYATLIKPLSRSLALAEIAALIERNHPELEERLSTAVELTAESETSALSSADLVAAIAKAATEDMRKLSPNREFTTRTVKPRLWAVLSAVLVLGGLFAAFPTATSRLIARALVPSAEVDNVYASAVTVTPGDKVVLAGTSVEIGVGVESGFPSRAYVRTSVGGRAESVERMTRTSAENEPARYAFVYPNVTESFSYRVNCGSALTRAYRIEAVPEPSYAGRRITVEHPAYTGRAADTYTNGADIVGIAGSRVTVRVRPSRPGVTGELLFTDGRRVAAEPAGDDLVFAFGLDAKRAGTWTSLMSDTYGFSNTVESANVEIVKDTPPEVKLLVPETRETKLPRTGILPLSFEAKDDFGIRRRALELCVGAGAWMELKELDGDDVTLPVAALPLENAAFFRVRVRVEDNLPEELGGPNVSVSEEVSVELRAEGAKSLARQNLSEEIAEAKKEIDGIRPHLERAWRALGSTHQLAGNGWHYDNAKKNLSLAKDELGNGDELLAAFVESLREGRLVTGAEIFTAVRDEHVTPLRRAVEDIYLLSSREAQGKAGTKAEKAGQRMMWAFDEAMRRFNLLTKKAEDLQQLEDFAEREAALAEAAEAGEMTAEELAEAEKQLEKDFAEEIKDDKALDLEAEKKKAAELQKRVDDLSERQEAAKALTGDEQKQAERRMMEPLQRLANEAAELTRNIEKKTGSPEMDANETSRPIADTQKALSEAANEAREATRSLEKGEAETARESMDAVSEALEQAKKSLAEAQAKLDAKSAEFAEASAEMSAAEEALAEARQATEAAAEQARQDGEKQNGEQQQGGDQQQNGEQQNGEQQQSGDQQKPGDPPQGSDQQQPGSPQPGPPQPSGVPQPSPAQKQMAAAMKKAAQALEKLSQAQMEKANLPPEAFQPGGAESEEITEGPSQPGQASAKAKPPRTKKRVARNPLADEAEGDWFRLKGTSAQQVERDTYDDVPAEYRSLVRDYFKALNEGGKK